MKTTKKITSLLLTVLIMLSALQVGALSVNSVDTDESLPDGSNISEAYDEAYPAEEETSDSEAVDDILPADDEAVEDVDSTLPEDASDENIDTYDDHTVNWVDMPALVDLDVDSLGLAELLDEQGNGIVSETLEAQKTKQVTASARKSIRKAPAANGNPSEGDGTYIEKINLRWLTADTPSDDGKAERLLVTPTGDSASQMKFQIDFALSGEKPYEPGTVELIIPMQIWKDRDGNPTGTMTLSVPEEPGSGANFAYRMVDTDGDGVTDSYYITNVRKLDAATKAMFQFSVHDVVPHTIIDQSTSDNFLATVNVITNKGNVLSLDSNRIYAQMDTYEKLTSAVKQNGRVYITPDEAKGANLPNDFLTVLPADADPSDYIFVRWYTYGVFAGNQPFTLSLSDTVEGKYNGLMLGVVGAKTVKSADGVSISTTEFDGYASSGSAKYAYVWTAYPKSAFPEYDTEYTLTNNASWKLEEKDPAVQGDDKVITQQQASATAVYKTPRVYKVVKVWDDNDDKKGVRPDHVDVNLYRSTRGNNYLDQLVDTVRLDESNDWQATWVDDSQIFYYWTVREKTVPSWYRVWYTSDENDSSVVRTYTVKNTYYEPGFIPTMSQWTHKYTSTYTDSNKKSSYDKALNVLRNGDDVVIQYRVYGEARIMPLTLRAGGNPYNLADYNKRYATMVVQDGTLSFTGTGQLDSDDYEIAAVTISDPYVYSYYQANPWNDWTYISNNQFGKPDVEVWGREAASGKWKLYARFKYDSSGNRTAEAFEGAEITGAKVTFPSGVDLVKTRSKTNAAGIYQSYSVDVRLKSSEDILKSVLDMFADEHDNYPMGTLRNTVYVSTFDDSGTRRMYGSEWSNAFLHGRDVKVATTSNKSMSMYRPTNADVAARRVKVKSEAVVREQSNMETLKEYNEAISEGLIPTDGDSTWYDLLPKGMEPILDSIKLQSGDVLTDAYTIPNWKDSGRTLLVVKAHLTQHRGSNGKEPIKDESGFYTDPISNIHGYFNTQKITFDSWYTWDAIHDFGNELDNIISFETGDEFIGNVLNYSGEPDDPTVGNNAQSASATKSFEDCMTDLDPESDGERFVYARGKVVVNPDIAALTSIHKQVSVDGSGIWSDGNDGVVYVNEGQSYTYRINVTSDSDTRTKNLIIYDAIERYVPTQDKDDYGAEQWRGTFASIDTSVLTEKGIAPKIYYSTNADIDLSAGIFKQNEKGHFIDQNGREEGTANFSGRVMNPGWTEQEPADKSKLVAIAVDASLKTDGTAFVLEPDEEVAVYIHMRGAVGDAAQAAYSKTADPKDPGNNAHAFNNAEASCVQSANANEETFAHIHDEYTKVGIRPYSIAVNKVWDDDSNRDGLRNDDTAAVVHLYANGIDTGKAVTLSKDNNWQDEFKNLAYGDENGDAIRYMLLEDSINGYTQLISRTGEGEYTVYNYHEPERTYLTGTKSWADETTTDDRPLSVTVELLKNGQPAGVKQVIRPDADGNWTYRFDDLYRYEEGKEIKWSVQEYAVYKYITDYETVTTEQDSEETVTVHTVADITNRYYPYGDLKIDKTVLNGTSAARGKEFTFTLTLTDSDNHALEDEFVFEKSDGTTGKIGNGGTFTLKDGEFLTVKDIPSETRYEISEDDKAGFTNTGRNGTYGSIRAGEETNAHFDNTYSAKGDVIFKAVKTLSDRVMTRNQFRFQIVDKTPGSSTYGEVIRNTASTAAENTVNRADGTVESSSGSVSFGAIRYTEQDDGKTFIYEMTEVDREKPGYTYDGKTIVVKVAIKDKGDGTMTVTPTYYERGAGGAETKLNSVSFNNVYKAEGDVSLKAWKQLKGRSLADGEFTFELIDLNTDSPTYGQVLQTKKNNADGEILWDKLSFNEKSIGKSFTYVVHEVSGSDDTVIYDTHAQAYVVTVADNGDGTLSFDQSFKKASLSQSNAWTVGEATEDLPVFQNELKPGVLTLTKRTENTDPNNPHQKFKFRIELEGEDLEHLDLEYQLEQLGSAQTNSSTAAAAAASAPQSRTASDAAVNTPQAPIAASIAASLPLAQAVVSAPTTADLPQPRSEAATEAVTEAASEAATEAVTETPKANRASKEAEAVGASGSTAGKAYAILTSSGELIFFRSTNNYYNSANITATDLNGKQYTGRLWTGVESTYSGGSIGFWYVSAYANQVTSVRFADGQIIQPTKTAHWFDYAPNVTKITNIKQLDTGNSTTMYFMFDGCSGLTSLDVSGFDTSKVTTMWRMFSGCSGLTSLDVSGFNTSNVTYMSQMFSGCSGLTSLDVSGFNTSNVTNMSQMFSGCSGLTSLNLSSFDTSQVTSMYNMFSGCSKLSEVTLGDKFSFMGKGNLSTSDRAILPTPPTTGGYSGRWTCIEHPEYSLTSTQLRDQYNGATMSGTWVWEIAKYKIAFNSNGGTGNMETIEVGINESVALPVCNFQNDDRTFLGWSLTATGTKRYNDGATVSKLTATKDATVTLYAVWSPETKYTLNFSPGAGSGSKTSVRTTAAQSYSFTPDGFYWFNHHVTGWKDNNGNSYNTPNVTIPANKYKTGASVTMTAQWAKDDNSVNLSDGAFYVELEADTKMTLPDLPAGTAYRIYEETPDGWVLVSQSGSSGEIEPLQTSAAEFTNRYEPDKASVQLHATKTLDGKPADANAFRFYLRAKKPNATTTKLLQTKSNAAGGAVLFDRIDYTLASITADVQSGYAVQNSDGSFTYQYTITEVKGTDSTIAYDAHTETVSVNVKSVEGGLLSATVTYQGSDAFANTTKPGAISISKEIAGALTASTKNQEFDVEIRLTKPGEVNSEVLTKRIKGGQTVTVSDLPAGTVYEIVEVRTPDGWTLTGSQGTDGTVKANQTSSSKLINTYVASGSAELEAGKTLEGKTQERGEFSFELYEGYPPQSGASPIQTAINGEPDLNETVLQEDPLNSDNIVEVKNPEYGRSIVLFDELLFDSDKLAQDAADGKAVFDQTAGTWTYSYTIREKAGDDDAVIYDNRSVKAALVIKDNADGNLSSTVTYSGGLYDGKNGFANKMKTGQLEVSKSIRNATSVSENQKFGFTLTFKDALGNELEDTYQVKIKNDGETVDTAEVTSGGTVEISADQTFVVEGLPHDCDYEIAETDNPSGWKMTACENERGTIQANETSSASFENTYSARGTAQFTVTKRVEAPSGVDDTFEAGDFSFELRDETGKLLQVKTNAAPDNHGVAVVTFDPIEYVEADHGSTFTYTISEVIGEDDHYEYDSHEEAVTVSVTDNGDGTMAVSSTCSADNPAEFVNQTAPITDLPETGGQGLWLITLLSVLQLAAISAVIQIKKRYAPARTDGKRQVMRK